jgi:hypothetical protein
LYIEQHNWLDLKCVDKPYVRTILVGPKGFFFSWKTFPTSPFLNTKIALFFLLPRYFYLQNSCWKGRGKKNPSQTNNNIVYQNS